MLHSSRRIWVDPCEASWSSNSGHVEPNGSTTWKMDEIDLWIMEMEINEINSWNAAGTNFRVKITSIPRPSQIVPWSADFPPSGSKKSRNGRFTKSLTVHLAKRSQALINPSYVPMFEFQGIIDFRLLKKLKSTPHLIHWKDTNKQAGCCLKIRLCFSIPTVQFGAALLDPRRYQRLWDDLILLS